MCLLEATDCNTLCASSHHRFFFCYDVNVFCFRRRLCLPPSSTNSNSCSAVLDKIHTEFDTFCFLFLSKDVLIPRGIEIVQISTDRPITKDKLVFLSALHTKNKHLTCFLKLVLVLVLLNTWSFLFPLTSSKLLWDPRSRSSAGLATHA